MKKKQKGLSNISNEFALNIKGEFVRLQKGMSKMEVTEILGEPFKIELSTNVLNEKLVFKINNANAIGARYSILFTSNELVYVAKLN